MIDPTLSLKDRIEKTIIALLNEDAVLSAIDAQQQATAQRKDRNPRIAVVATPGAEVTVQAGIFKTPVSIEIFFDIPKSDATDFAPLEDAANRVETIIETTQAQGRFGIIRNGGSTQNLGLTVKRTILLTVVSA